jgi:SAM-dependent methyltransferase
MSVDRPGRRRGCAGAAPQDVLDHYAMGRERDRLAHGHGRLEALRTTELLERWLPAAPATVLDVGGAAGRYALPLAAQGYAVHLVDPVPLHVEQALAASASAQRPLAAVLLGDARALPYDDASADAVLLLGPLYHLVDREDRLTALREARRVLRPGGVVVAAAISRWASTADGICAGHLRDPRFAAMVEHDVRTGVHENPSQHPGWFATAWFSRPEELVEEVAEAGLVPDGPVAVEGLGGTATDLDAMLDDPGTRERVLAAVRRVEREPSLLGASPHLLVCGRLA